MPPDPGWTARAGADADRPGRRGRRPRRPRRSAQTTTSPSRSGCGRWSPGWRPCCAGWSGPRSWRRRRTRAPLASAASPWTPAAPEHGRRAGGAPDADGVRPARLPRPGRRAGAHARAAAGRRLGLGRTRRARARSTATSRRCEPRSAPTGCARSTGWATPWSPGHDHGAARLPTDAARPLDAIGSIKVKLGLLVVASVVAAALLGAAGSGAGVPLLLALPVAMALALGVTQLLAAGMVAPLREMTTVARRMARGDYSGRIDTQATDEVGRLAKAFNPMADDLATVDRERRDLVATVSHEIRTPLAGLTALLENLADGVVPTDGPHLAGALAQARAAGRARGRPAGPVPARRRDGSPRRPADRRCADLVAATAREVAAGGRDVRVDVQVPDHVSLAGDPIRLRQLRVEPARQRGTPRPGRWDRAGHRGRVGRRGLARGGGLGPRCRTGGPGAGLRAVRHPRRQPGRRRHRPRAGDRPMGGRRSTAARLRFVDPTPGHAAPDCASSSRALPRPRPPLTEEIAMATATPAPDARPVRSRDPTIARLRVRRP